MSQADKMYRVIAKRFPFENNEMVNSEIAKKLNNLGELLCDLIKSLGGAE